MSTKPKSSSAAASSGSSSKLATTPEVAHSSSGSHKKKKTTSSSGASATKYAPDYVSQMDFSTVEDRVLRRYKRAFKLRGKKESRDELVSAVTKHFTSQEVVEKDVITYFIYSLRNLDNVYKLPPKTPPPATAM